MTTTTTAPKTLPHEMKDGKILAVSRDDRVFRLTRPYDAKEFPTIEAAVSRLYEVAAIIRLEGIVNTTIVSSEPARSVTPTPSPTVKARAANGTKNLPTPEDPALAWPDAVIRALPKYVCEEARKNYYRSHAELLLSRIPKTPHSFKALHALIAPSLNKSTLLMYIALLQHEGKINIRQVHARKKEITRVR